jgi:hypothetical protein
VVSGVVVATMTLARTPAEEAEIGRALDALQRTNLPVIAADGGSSQQFVDALAQRANFTIVPAEPGGLVGQVKASLKAARPRGAWILYTEPDKTFFFDARLRDFLTTAAAASEAGLVLASRNQASFATFPPVQRATETALNGLCGAFTKLEADYSYGPFLVRSELVNLVEPLDASVGWGWRPFLFAGAARTGHRTAAVAGDYPCPVDQRSEDEGEQKHRLRQLAQNIDGLTRAVTASEAALWGSSRRP